MKILELFGLIRLSKVAELRTELAVSAAINHTLQEEVERLEEKMGQCYRESERVNIAYAQIGDHHEKTKRAAAVLALAVQRLHPATQGLSR